MAYAKRKRTSKPKTDVVAEVTGKLVEQIEAGNPPPWRCAHAMDRRLELPVNTWSGRPYSGGNIMLLWVQGFLRGFSSHLWVTYDQAQWLGGQVPKHAKGVKIRVFRRGDDERLPVNGGRSARAGQEGDKKGGYRGGYAGFKTVFNAEQCGIKLPPVEKPDSKEFAGVEGWEMVEMMAIAEGLSANTGLTIAHGMPGCASYHRPTDRLSMPSWEAFRDAKGANVTFAHELVHATGRKDRLGRHAAVSKLYESPRSQYAFEELVAEMSAAMICAALGLSGYDGDGSADYCCGYLGALKEEPGFLMEAGVHAGKAMSYLLDFLESDESTSSSEGEASEDVA